MPAGDPHGLLAAGHRQPDRLSCGATAGLWARALHDPALAATLREDPARFSAEVLLLHRRLTGPRGADGRLQVPWPRALGTPPWSLARHLSRITGRRHRVRLLRGPGRARTYEELRGALASGAAAPLYVGSALLPRHVLLALPDDVATALLDDGAGTAGVVVLDPATGRPRRELPGAPQDRRLAQGWPVPWFAVLPRQT